MTDTKYGVIKNAEPQFPVRELLVVPHEGKALTLSFPAFGPGVYRENVAEMAKDYSHPQTRKKISFRPAITSESISAAAYDFLNMAKPKIFDPRWLQIGHIVRTQDGVFTNTTEIDESKLKQLLNGAEKVNGIYLLSNKIAFAPFESFEQ